MYVLPQGSRPRKREVSNELQVFEVNVFSVMKMVQVFAPMLIEAKGTIVQIGSIAGKLPYVFGSVYNASKAALHSYNRTLRVELEPFGPFHSSSPPFLLPIPCPKLPNT